MLLVFENHRNIASENSPAPELPPTTYQNLRSGFSAAGLYPRQRVARCTFVRQRSSLCEAGCGVPKSRHFNYQRTRELKTLSIEIRNLAKQATEWLKWFLRHSQWIGINKSANKNIWFLCKKPIATGKVMSICLISRNFLQNIADGSKFWVLFPLQDGM